MTHTNAKLSHSDLSQFTGTDTWYRHGLVRNVLYTDGVKFLAERAGAFWLLDKVATLQIEPRVRAEEFQTWRLAVSEGQKATLTCDDGNGNVVHSERIGWTDFPLDEVKLYVGADGARRVVMLPSEY